ESFSVVVPLTSLVAPFRVESDEIMSEQRLAEMETAFSALKQEVTDRADETSQAFSRLKNSLDHTESLTQQRRSKATGGGALMTNC
ncbi:hypothetical protein AAIE13_20795, partial [Escherichia coli]